MEDILLSILIPTYNRYKYLKGCLSSIVRIKSERIEIIVQDNTEQNDEIIEYINKLSDSRIKYYHYQEHVSQTENSDLAMSHAVGKYIVMIGDDDSICESIVYACEFCEKNGIDAANYLFPGFNWPDMEFIGKSSEPNYFLEEKADGRVEIHNAEDSLNRALKLATGLQNDMPRAYHGLVSKKVMDTIYAKTGSYFPGPSPDMGNAAAVCLVAKKAAFIYDYLIVSGYGYNSARGEGNRQSHFGKIEEKPWLPKDILERWDPSIPKIFSGETIIATSLTESLKRMGREDLAKKYNYGVMYAMFLRYHPDAASKLVLFCLKNPIRLKNLICGIIERMHVRRKILKTRSENKLFYQDMGIESLEEAQSKTEEIRTQIGLKQLFLKNNK